VKIETSSTRQQEMGSASQMIQQNNQLESNLSTLDSQYQNLQESIVQQNILLAAEIKRNQQIWADYLLKEESVRQMQDKLSQVKDQRL
jgi:hypothetical protein